MTLSPDQLAAIKARCEAANWRLYGIEESQMVDFGKYVAANDIDAGSDRAAEIAKRAVEQWRRVGKVVVPVDVAYLMAKEMRAYAADEVAKVIPPDSIPVPASVLAAVVEAIQNCLTIIDGEMPTRTDDDSCYANGVRVLDKLKPYLPASNSPEK